DLESVNQYVADRIGPSLAEKRVAFALSVRLDVADDQESIGQHGGLDHGIGDASQRLVGFRLDDRGIGVELDVDVEARQLGKLAQPSPRRSHYRYPASSKARVQFLLTPCVVARQGTDLLVSLVEPAHNLTISRAHTFATVARAATRFWIASKLRR